MNKLLLLWYALAVFFVYEAFVFAYSLGRITGWLEMR